MPNFQTPYAPSQPYRQNNTIAQLIMQAAAQQAEGQRRGGAIWGNAVQDVGAIAGNTIRDIAEGKRRKVIDDQNAIIRGQQIEQNAAGLEQIQQKKRLSDVMSNQQSMSDSGQAMTPESIAQNLQANGLGEFVPQVLKAHEDTRASLLKQKEATNYALAQYADNASRFVGTPIWDSVLAQAATDLKDIVPNSQQVIKQLQGMAPEQQKMFLGNLVGLSQTYQKEKSAEDKANRVVVPEGSSIVNFGADGKPVVSVQGTPKADTRGLEARFADAVAKGDIAGAKVLEDAIKRATRAGKQAPTPSYQPKMIMVNGKEVQANYDSNTGKYYDPDTGAVLRGIQSPPTADMRNKTEGRKLVKKSVSSIRTISEGILTKVGPAQRAEAIKRGAEAVFGSDPAFRTYQDARTALAGNLAVAQQGSRPSDADIKSVWLPLVPDPYRDTRESATMKWDLIEQMSNIDEPMAPAKDKPVQVPRKPGESMIDYLRRTSQ